MWSRWVWFYGMLGVLLHSTHIMHDKYPVILTACGHTALPVLCTFVAPIPCPTRPTTSLPTTSSVAALFNCRHRRSPASRWASPTLHVSLLQIAFRLYFLNLLFKRQLAYSCISPHIWAACALNATWNW